MPELIPGKESENQPFSCALKKEDFKALTILFSSSPNLVAVPLRMVDAVRFVFVKAKSLPSTPGALSRASSDSV